MENVVQFLAEATEGIASSYCLQNTTTTEEIEECKGLLERSIAAHPELLSLKPEDLHRNHLAHYDDLTSNMTIEEKRVFTPELYNSIVEASIGAMRLLLRVTSSMEVTEEVTSSSTSSMEVTEEVTSEEVIVTRDDLVADYIGLTEKKTLDFLEANRGKVIILEDPSIICRDDKDYHGKQALITMNQWLKDNAPPE